MSEETDRGDETIGQMLKRLRGDISLRGVQRLSGISNAYLSQIEKGLRHPGSQGSQKIGRPLRRRSTGASQESRLLG